MVLSRQLTVGALFCALTAMVTVSGCGGGGSSSSSTPTSGMRVAMHDSPAAYQHVNLTISEVDSVGGGGGVTVLNSTPQTFDLLALQNGVTRVIATDGVLPPGTYNQI